MKKVILLCALLLPVILNAQSKEELDSAKIIDHNERAEDLINRYVKKRYNRRKTFPIFGKRYDARSCWFSLKVIDSLAKVAHQQTGATVTGVRFYYGLYKKDKTNRYSKRHTLVFVPTKDSIEKVPAKLGGTKDTVYHYDLKKSQNNKDAKDYFVFALPRTTRNGEVITQNHGDMCPPPSPPCPCKGNELGQQSGNNTNCIVKKKRNRRN